MTSWTNGKPLGAPFFGRKKGAQASSKEQAKRRRLALIKRRHRAWLRYHTAVEGPSKDDDTVGDIDDVLLE